MIAPETFIEVFRRRHGWKCRPGSAIAKDLTDFATEQAASAHSADDLYILFCVTNGVKPKPADGQALKEAKE